MLLTGASGRLPSTSRRPSKGLQAVESAESNAVMWLVRALAVVRVVQLVPGVVVLTTASWAFASPAAAAALLLVEVVWTLALFGVALRRGWFSAPWVVTDVALQALIVVAVGRLCVEGLATQAQNWAVGPTNGAVVLASLFLGRPAFAAATCALLASYVAGVWPEVATHATNAASNVAWLAALALAAAILGNRLLSDARQVDVSAQQAALAEQERARLEARLDERSRQYQRLHDTVLSTLEGISRGGLDYVEADVRQRCAADANLVRSMNVDTEGTAESAPSLPVLLGDIIHAVEAFGLRVHLFVDRDSPALPADVVRAAGGAVREALNNVVKHAAVDEAWVSIRATSGGGSLIRVVDRGNGFDPDDVRAGGGLDRSIRRRWDAVGGQVQIDSGATGTMLELTWSP